MNVELLLKVKEAILAQPEMYDQDEFCESAHCIAGFAVAIAEPQTWRLLKEKADGPMQVSYAARRLLDVPDRFNWQSLCGHAWQWPAPFDDQYAVAESSLSRAQVAAARIDHFIATGGAA